MRLIDANDLMQTIFDRKYMLTATNGFMDYGMFITSIQRAVDEQQTIDLDSSRPQGEWKFLYDWGYQEVWQCTNCKTEFTFFNDPRDKRMGCNYCSVCGVKMKIKEESLR